MYISTGIIYGRLATGTTILFLAHSFAKKAFLLGEQVDGVSLQF